MLTKDSATGRVSGGIADAVRLDIEAGRYEAGQFVPTVIELSERYEVSRETARRALKTLEREGFLKGISGTGFRVMGHANDPAKGRPVAYLSAAPLESVHSEPFHRQLNAAFQQAVTARGWSWLSMNTGSNPASEIMDHLLALKASGVILDVMHRKLLEPIEKAGIPAIMVNAWEEHTQLDAVVQDNYRGGYLAAEYLTQQGHDRVTWFGPVAESPLSRERYAGACATMAAAGHPPPEIVELDFPGGLSENERFQRARALLSRKKKTLAVLALWGPLALAVSRAAEACGRSPGRDIHLVGWSPEETFNHVYESLSRPPVSVAWSMQAMAETAIARLNQRRENPGLPPLRISIPTRLRLQGGKP